MRIDYGNGLTNLDPTTGIRYGVIHSNKLMGEAFSDIESNGTDLDFEDHKEELKIQLSDAIKGVLESLGHARANDSDDLADGIVDSLEWDGYESPGDCTRYEYESDGYHLQTCSDGDIFVLKSPYKVKAAHCSPCAPGACSIDSPCDDGAWAYCLGAEWFEEGECPYADRIELV